MKLNLSLAFCVVALSVFACKNRHSNGHLETSDNSSPESPGAGYHPVIKFSATFNQKDKQRNVQSSVDGFQMFSRGALAQKGVERMPFVMFRILPEFAYRFSGEFVFGPPGQEFSDFGFFYDERSPWPVPQGFTFSIPGDEDPSQHGLSYAVRTCASCHIGRVRVGSKINYLDGAANIRMDLHKFNYAMVRFLNNAFSPENRENSKRILLSLLQEKEASANWFFNNKGNYNLQGEFRTLTQDDEVKQIQIFKDNIDVVLKEIYESNLFRVKASETLVKNFGQAKANPQSIEFGPAGIADTGASGIAGIVTGYNSKQVDPNKQFSLETLFKGSTKVAIPSVWQQEQRKSAQWDASVTNVFFRNAIAAIGFVSSPSDLSAINLQLVTEYIDKLPAPKYPFTIDAPLAKRGEVIYQKANCEGCHVPKQSAVPAVQQIGTDTNRMQSVTSSDLLAVVAGALMTTCSGNESNESLIMKVNGIESQPCRVKKQDILIPRIKKGDQGYPASPLDGIWARAPYLHNGSVPTLYHLLATKNGDSLRPDLFQVGSIDYDTDKVGYFWQIKTGLPRDLIYETKMDGFSNKGHQGDPKTGIYQGYKITWDISNEQEKDDLLALIEFLKTL